MGSEIEEIVSGYRVAMSWHRWLLGGLGRAYGKW